MSSPVAPEIVTQEQLLKLRGPGFILERALDAANAARRDGVKMKDLDSFLLHRYKMTYKGLAAAVKAMPQEVNSKKDVTTKMLLKAQAYGLTGGWTDEIEGLIGALRGTGYAKARKNAIAEMKKFEEDYPWLARGAKAYGLGAGALLGGGAAVRYVKPVGAALRAGVGAALGANAGAGGVLGEESGAGRLPNMAGGALMGVGAGAGAVGMPTPSKIAKIGGLLGAGAVGKKLLDMFLNR